MILTEFTMVASLYVSVFVILTYDALIGGSLIIKFAYVLVRAMITILYISVVEHPQTSILFTFLCAPLLPGLSSDLSFVQFCRLLFTDGAGVPYSPSASDVRKVTPFPVTR